MEDGEEKERVQQSTKDEQQKLGDGSDNWLVLESEENRSQRSKAFLLVAGRLKARPEWAPYFKLLSPMYKMIAETVIVPVQSAPREETEELRAPSPSACMHGINEKCSSYTGKLRSCHACGKLETKRGDMSKCVTYCAEEVRILLPFWNWLLCYFLSSLLHLHCSVPS